MSLFITAAMAAGGERAYRYRLGDLLISYRIPTGLQAAYTRVNDSAVHDGDQVMFIYKTAFSARFLFREKFLGNFTMAILEMPDELRDDHSMARLSAYYQKGITSDLEVAKASLHVARSGEWLQIERRPVSDLSQISGVLFYQVISANHILYVGMGAQPPDWFPERLVRKIRPQVHMVLESIDITNLGSTQR